MSKVLSLPAAQGPFSPTDYSDHHGLATVTPKDSGQEEDLDGEKGTRKRRSGYQLAKGVATSIPLLKTDVGIPGHPDWSLDSDLVT